MAEAIEALSNMLLSSSTSTSTSTIISMPLAHRHQLSTAANDDDTAVHTNNVHNNDDEAVLTTTNANEIGSGARSTSMSSCSNHSSSTTTTAITSNTITAGEPQQQEGVVSMTQHAENFSEPFSFAPLGSAAASAAASAESPEQKQRAAMLKRAMTTTNAAERDRLYAALAKKSSFTDSNIVPRCFGCQQSIADRFMLKVLDLPWHTHCLKCCQCLQPLASKCFIRDGLAYCRTDFYTQFGTRCTACERGIPPDCIIRYANEFIFHNECFRCYVCQRKFETGEEFYLLDTNKHQLVCKTDYETARNKGVEASYKSSAKPARHVREKLSQDTGLEMRVVQVWFQNRRAKEKRLKREVSRSRWPLDHQHTSGYGSSANTPGDNTEGHSAIHVDDDDDDDDNVVDDALLDGGGSGDDDHVIITQTPARRSTTTTVTASTTDDSSQSVSVRDRQKPTVKNDLSSGNRDTSNDSVVKNSAELSTNNVEVDNTNDNRLLSLQPFTNVQQFLPPAAAAAQPQPLPALNFHPQSMTLFDEQPPPRIMQQNLLFNDLNQHLLPPPPPPLPQYYAGEPPLPPPLITNGNVPFDFLVQNQLKMSTAPNTNEQHAFFNTMRFSHPFQHHHHHSLLVETKTEDGMLFGANHHQHLVHQVNNSNSIVSLPFGP